VNRGNHHQGTTGRSQQSPRTRRDRKHQERECDEVHGEVDLDRGRSARFCQPAHRKRHRVVTPSDDSGDDDHQRRDRRCRETQPSRDGCCSWRRGRDLNPRGPCDPNGFQDRRHKPGSATPPRSTTDSRNVAQRLPMTSRPPMYGRSCSGTSIVPSGRWYVSMIASIVRVSARPLPLIVCANRGGAPRDGR
jgi:hypothetical protein